MQYLNNKQGNNIIVPNNTNDMNEKSSGITANPSIQQMQINYSKMYFNQPSKKAHPKCKFTPEEDEKLKILVNKMINTNMENKSKCSAECLSNDNKDESNEDMIIASCIDWNDIALQMKSGRNARQCRERWINYLSPSVVNGPWTKEEDDLLCQKYNEIGSHWKKIASFFPSRTDINVKSRYHLLERRKRKIEKNKEKLIKKQKMEEEIANRKLLMDKILKHSDKNTFLPTMNPIMHLNQDISKISNSPLPFFPYQNSNNEHNAIFNANYANLLRNMQELEKTRKAQKKKKQTKVIETQEKENVEDINNFDMPTFMFTDKEFEMNSNECWNSLLMNDENNDLESFYFD